MHQKNRQDFKYHKKNHIKDKVRVKHSLGVHIRGEKTEVRELRKGDLPVVANAVQLSQLLVRPIFHDY